MAFINISNTLIFVAVAVLYNCDIATGKTILVADCEESWPLCSGWSLLPKSSWEQEYDKNLGRYVIFNGNSSGKIESTSTRLIRKIECLSVTYAVNGTQAYRLSFTFDFFKFGTIESMYYRTIYKYEAFSTKMQDSWSVVESVIFPSSISYHFDGTSAEYLRLTIRWLKRSADSRLLIAKIVASDDEKCDSEGASNLKYLGFIACLVVFFLCCCMCGTRKKSLQPTTTNLSATRCTTTATAASGTIQQPPPPAAVPPAPFTYQLRSLAPLEPLAPPQPQLYPPPPQYSEFAQPPPPAAVPPAPSTYQPRPLAPLEPLAPPQPQLYPPPPQYSEFAQPPPTYSEAINMPAVAKPS
ncbi:uncharacterized protein LOC141912115 [Tubulanus polymorphus]|uniref:uncharacterized protein LOC141912115 n=1 Tax=Tubulanus polymorphus TaxID=672921 RepID=UPI003DA27A1F